MSFLTKRISPLWLGAGIALVMAVFFFVIHLTSDKPFELSDFGILGAMLITSAGLGLKANKQLEALGDTQANPKLARYFTRIMYAIIVLTMLISLIAQRFK